VGFGIDVTEELSAKAELERAKRLLESRVLEQVREITDARMATIFAMAKRSESRDEDTERHLERTQRFCYILAGVLCSDPKFSAEADETFKEALHSASPLHDIGKVAIPDSVLLKPARLEAEEFEIMKAHTVLGAFTLDSVRGKHQGNFFIDMGVDIARSHHERWDGQGYPDGISGLGIPLPARIMAVADVCDALRSRRCYTSALGHEESVLIIAEQAGRAFDPMIAQALIDNSASFDQVWLQLQD
jgi:putative two-component system response regulator